MGLFNRDSTAEEVLDGLDLSGLVVAITGTSSGLGEESARVLAARGARVAMLARDSQKNEAAADRIRSTVPDADLSTYEVDLTDLASVTRFVHQSADSLTRIDVLMNNAGVMCCPFSRTADGFEMQFGTNHLGHFALTAQLLPRLQQAEQPRVITLSSGGHRISDIDLEDPNFAHTDYDPWVAYGRSKSANIHFAAELAQRMGHQLLSFSVHPGAIGTRLSRHMTKEVIDAMMERAKQSETKEGGGGFQMKSLEAGAATQVWAATSSDIANRNGQYLADCGPTELGPGEQGYAPHAYNPSIAARLWELSEELVGLSFES